jgi:hypothetical protein
VLADARLITLGADTAEVAQAALIREWPRLREWLNQDREALRLSRQLRRTAQEWELGVAFGVATIVAGAALFSG